MYRFKIITNILFFLSSSLTFTLVKAQNSAETPIQFSGVIFTEDSTQTVPFTTLYIPKTGRGTISSQYGIFSMPVLPRDSVVIIATGFKKLFYRIPDSSNNNSISVMIVLRKDTLELPLVEVFPYQTEEIFKQAFLALHVPDNQNAAMEKTMNDRIIAMMSSEVTSDGQMTHSWYARQYAITQQQKYQNPAGFNNYLSPIAWAQFVNALRKGKYKKKEYDEKGAIKSK